MDDWRDHAACRHEDPDLFHPIGTSGPTLMQTEEAKAVCRRAAESNGEIRTSRWTPFSAEKRP